MSDATNRASYLRALDELKREWEAGREPVIIPRVRYEALMAELNRIAKFCADRAKRFPLTENVCGRVAVDIQSAVGDAGIETEE